MTFPNRKKTYLAKLDKSKKNEIDRKIVPLIRTINKNKNYFTTSSCSGRIVVWKGLGKKDETEWVKVSHDPISNNFFSDLKEEMPVWLRFEPFILHVCCKDLNSANELLNLSKHFFKKSSILSISNKIIVEVRGSEFLEIPLMKDNKFLISDLTFLVDVANQKLRKTNQKMVQFLESLKKNIKKEKKEINLFLKQYA